MYVDRNVRLSTLIICRRRFLRCFPMDSSINREIAKMGKRLSETSDQSPSTYFEGELSWMTLNEYRRVLWKVPPVSDLKSYYQPCTNNMNAFLHNIILQSQHLDMSPQFELSQPLSWLLRHLHRDLSKPQSRQVHVME